MDDTGSGFLLVFVIAAALFLLYEFSFQNTTTVYFEICEKEECQPIEISRSFFKFKVLVPEQVVVLLAEDGSLGKLPNCSVYNKKNWRCDDIKMIDGSLESSNISQDGVLFVNKWTWYLGKIKELLHRMPA